MPAEKIDKSSWGPGPWQDEPDRVEFRAHGFPCLLKRVPNGHWCCYVGVPPGHPWHGKADSDAYDLDVSVHGGVTYGAACDGDPVNGVCHTPQAGEPEHAWWIGADFAHGGDMSPGRCSRELLRYGWRPEGRYWDVNMVRAECESLAAHALNHAERKAPSDAG